ncbi:hypothetical protein ACQP1P_26050 [Dactylosporangium sp. CA-052675]|uniref:hypothetical protein n=1 Tax=Dactylosporangium sp. CA-052675 TaxID=3239927 RepID=UPI003D8CDE83
MTLPNDDTGHLADPGSPDDTDEFDRDADRDSDRQDSARQDSDRQDSDRQDSDRQDSARQPPALDPLNGEPDATTTGAPLGPPD